VQNILYTSDLKQTMKNVMIVKDPLLDVENASLKCVLVLNCMF